MKKALKTAARGTVFPYAGEKWVALEHEAGGRTLCLRLDLIPDKPFDENNRNNFAISSSKEWMNGPYGPPFILQEGGIHHEHRQEHRRHQPEAGRGSDRGDPRRAHKRKGGRRP